MEQAFLLCDVITKLLVKLRLGNVFHMGVWISAGVLQVLKVAGYIIT